MSTIRTKWSETIDKSCPLNEYPRPQMARDSYQCLNGEYDYAVLPLAQKTMGESHGKILVPFAVETELSGVEKPLDEHHALWYRRTFTVAEDYDGKRVLLHFGAVDWQCEVWVNGVAVGSHIGGYCPFTFDITDYLDEENELIVRVVDPTDKGGQPRGKQVQKPVGFWYTATSGIWQTVWLEVVPRHYIRQLKLTPDIDRSVLRVETPQNVGSRLKVEVRDGEKVVASAVITEGESVAIPNARLWSPEEPFLYDLSVSLLDGDEAVDTVSSYFGMRKFSMAKDQNGYLRLCLNNKPYFQKGLLDQGYWPDGGLTAPSDEALIYDIQTMRDLGFNVLRKHIKVEPLRWYYHCDRLGMLVWQDMPNGCDVNMFVAGVLPNINLRTLNDKHEKLFCRTDPKAQDLFRAELDEMLSHLYNVVSICCWVPFNESWGQFDAVNVAKHVKQFDPTRFVDHASGWHDQGAGDFKSIHRYVVPLNTLRADKRAFVISEYGGYSRVIEGHVWNRQKCFGYRMFKDEQTLSDAYRKLHEKQVYHLLKKGLCALIYTQVSDVENEVNGILTYDRKLVKLDEAMIREINAKLTY
ncbi:MAG: glycoside hydrolase family 2 [Clostridia bacterium]|nr:glycoside hydrolase family 2 [Clostridia bacterium]